MKLDANHAAIVRDLRMAGCTVVDLSKVGGGCPDLLVGRGRSTYLLEVKSPERARYARASERRQAEWRAAWRGGPVAVVTDLRQALLAVGAAH